MEKTNNQGRKGQGGRPSVYEESFMHQVIWAYETGNESISQIAERFNVSKSQVKAWRSRFSSDLVDPTPAAALMTEQEQQLAALKKQNEELTKKLEQASLQILGLQTMIDVAEEALKIDIRKKSGPKQSKK